jgi:hypothetical protein
MKGRINTHGLIPKEIQLVAEAGYVYGYPLVLLDVMRRIHTAVPFPTSHGAPVNQFAHSRFVPGPHTKEPFRPFADSLRSVAWLDLSKEPIILSVPPTDRYYVLSVFSAWGDLIDSVSPRTCGMKGGRFVLVGPRWRGELPDDVRRIMAPAETLWINGRIQAAGVEDIQTVHGVQDQLRLTPLSESGKTVLPHSAPFRPYIDRETPPEQQVARLAAPAFFSRLSRLMQKNPPQVFDSPMIGRLGRLGFLPHGNFSFETLPSNTVQAMNTAVPAAQLIIASAAKASTKQVNNWSMKVHPGCFESNYLTRAVAAQNAYWGALAEDVIAFHASVDQAGDGLRGTDQYVLHFDPEHTPPVRAFWSITVYDSRQLLPDNAIQRHFIGDRDRLRHDSDNSLSIYLQHDWPGTSKDSNWLPVPKDPFNLILQLYWPKPEVLNGKWRPPAVMRVH